LEPAVRYARERVPFGRVIGASRAVKHMPAEPPARVDPARAAVTAGEHARRLAETL